MPETGKRKGATKQALHGYVRLEGSERKRATGAHFLGPADPNETFRVIISVRRRPGAPSLPDLAHWKSIPHGQRKYLTAEQFGAIYGAAPAELEEVASYARSKGLAVAETSIARRTVVATGSVEQMNRAFAVELGRYKTDKETYRGREGYLHIACDIAPLVEGVFGLDNRRVGHDNSAPNIDPQITGPLDAWTVAKLYNFPTNPANGEVIGIITIHQPAGFSQGDLTTYFNNLNSINGTNLQAPVPLIAKGGVNSPGNQQNDFELTQDICVASTVAQGATILVFFETPDSAGWIDFVKRASAPVSGDPAVNVLSISNVISSKDDENSILAAGFTSAAITTLETAFQEASIMGVTIFAACGDDGSQFNGVEHSVQWPASNPWVTACGGTTIGYLNQSATQPVEWVWNDQDNQSNFFAGGGGISAKYPLPDYQNGIVTQTSLNDNGVRRGLPDIAGNASQNSGYALWVDGTNKVEGTNINLVANGTSIVAPLYAGLAAVINAQLGQSIGFLNPVLYAFHDTVCRDVNDQLFPGSPVDNGVGASPGYPSGPGWDACTGLGVVDGSALLSVLQEVFTKRSFFIMERSTFGKDEVDSLGVNPEINPAYWVAVDGFRPEELQLTQNNLNAPPIRPHITLSVDPGTPPAQATAIQAMLAGIDNFPGTVLPLDSELPNTPQRFLFPFAIVFTNDAGFTPNNASVTLTATLTVNNSPYASTAQIFLVQKENPYLLDANPSDPEQPLWLSFDLRFFKANQGTPRFGVPGINDPSSAPGFIASVIHNLNTPNTNLGGDSFDSLTQDEDKSALEFQQQVNGQYVFNYALARVRLRGTTPAQMVRVFFRLFQAQTTVSDFNLLTTYRRFPNNGVQYGQKIALLGVQNDQNNQPEYVTVPCFAAPRVNLNGVADLTTQTDPPNAQSITPVAGQEVDTFFGCWLDINQPDQPLFPSFPPTNDWDNSNGT
jgi:kumamolisin